MASTDLGIVAVPSVSVDSGHDILIRAFSIVNQDDISPIYKLVEDTLPESYSIFTYKYFLLQWPFLTFMAFHHDRLVGVVIGSLMDPQVVTEGGEHGVVQGRELDYLFTTKTSAEKVCITYHGYIAMLVVHPDHRNQGIATRLISHLLDAFTSIPLSSIYLETECTNLPSLSLYHKFGFIKSEFLYRYYCNNQHAYRLLKEING